MSRRCFLTTICKYAFSHTYSFYNTDGDRLATLDIGGPCANVYFVQHGSYAAQAQRILGPEIVDRNYPMDHTHTAPFLADVVCEFTPMFSILLTRLQIA